MSQITDLLKSQRNIIKLFGYAAISLPLFFAPVEINGAADGEKGISINDGWEEICDLLTKNGIKIDYNMKTFYENGWYVCQQQRKEV